MPGHWGRSSSSGSRGSAAPGGTGGGGWSPGVGGKQHQPKAAPVTTAKGPPSILSGGPTVTTAKGPPSVLNPPTPPVTTGGPPSVLNPPTPPVTIGGPPSVLNPPTPPTQKNYGPFTAPGRMYPGYRGTHPFWGEKTAKRIRAANLGLDSSNIALDETTGQYVNLITGQLLGYTDPSSSQAIGQNLYGQGATQIGYVPEYAKPSGMYSTSIAQGLYKKAIEEGVGPKEFETWLKGEGSMLKETHPDYADILSKELQISDWDKIYPSKDLDVKGRNTEEKQREALNTLMGELQTKKSALKDSDKEWMLSPTDKFEKDMLNRELTGDYEKNKDRLNDLGITSKEEYEDLVNRSISLARGGVVDLYKYGGFI